jgi:hypothetical protein
MFEPESTSVDERVPIAQFQTIGNYECSWQQCALHASWPSGRILYANQWLKSKSSFIYLLDVDSAGEGRLQVPPEVMQGNGTIVPSGEIVGEIGKCHGGQCTYRISAHW